VRKVILASLIISSIPSLLFSQTWTAPSGSDYANAVPNKWTEDSASEIVNTVNAFNCIIKNSRGDLAQHVNGTWAALVDQEKCFGGATSGAVNYASSVNQSTRASSTSPQEMKTWFNTTDAQKVLGMTTMSASAADAPPYGNWYFSYMFPRVSGSTTLPFDATQDQTGFADISTVGTDVVVKVGENSPGEYKTAGKITILGGDSDTAKFIGYTDNYYSGSWNPNYFAGVTNATRYFKAALNSSGSVTGSKECYKRDKTWQGNHATFLYYKNAYTDSKNIVHAAGSRASIFGSLRFKINKVAETAYHETEGELAQWGTWSRSGYPFSSESGYQQTAVKAESADAAENGKDYTLHWGPGKLSALTQNDAVLSDGDTFRWWGEPVRGSGANIWGEWIAEYDLSNTAFNLTNKANSAQTSTLTSSDVTSNTWQKWMYSDLLNSGVQWDTSGGKVLYDLEVPLKATNSIAAAAATKFLCTSTDRCPAKASSGSIVSDTTGIVQDSDYANNGRQTDAFIPLDGSGARMDLTAGSNTNIYFYTGMTPSTGLKPLTLYYDSNANDTLDTTDTPVIFGFRSLKDGGSLKVNGANGGTVDTTYATTDDNLGVSFSDFVLASDVTANICTVASPASCTKYRWDTGARHWNSAFLLTDASGGVALEDNLKFEYTHTAANDVNNGLGDFKFVSQYVNWNSPALMLGTSSTINGNTYYDARVNAATSFNGQKFILRYNGRWIDGLPGVDNYVGGSQDRWIKLANIKDGTTLTDTAGVEYITKAAEISYNFLPASVPYVNGADLVCDALAFTTSPYTGETMDESLPDYTDTVSYPRPAFGWNVPAVDSTSCAVVHGVATCP
jgi:hypothetical protein